MRYKPAFKPGMSLLFLTETISAAIQTGNMKQLDELWQNLICDEPSDSIFNVPDRLFTLPLISIMHQAALNGNADPAISGALQKQYSEKCFSSPSLSLLQAASYDFCRIVDTVKSEMELIRLIEKYIQDHLHEKITIAKMAHNCAVSERSLYSIFNLHFHSGINEYIQKERLKRAAVMIVSTRKTLSEIALSLGYSGSSSFTQYFNRYYGCTPSEYRKRVRNNSFDLPPD